MDMTVVSHVDMLLVEDMSLDLTDLSENQEMSLPTQEDMSKEMNLSSQERLLTWFQEYNQELGTDYLTQEHNILADGDGPGVVAVPEVAAPQERQPLAIL